MSPSHFSISQHSIGKYRSLPPTHHWWCLPALKNHVNRIIHTFPCMVLFTQHNFSNPCTLLLVSVVHSFLLLRNISLYEERYLYLLPTVLLMDTCVSNFKLPWNFCTSPFLVYIWFHFSWVNTDKENCEVSLPPTTYECSIGSISSLTFGGVSPFSFGQTGECVFLAHCGYILHFPND